MSELHEMGWNDVAGNLARATEERADKKRSFCERLISGEIRLPRDDADYVQGTKDAAKAFLAGETLEYRGPDWVIAGMQEKSK